MEGILLRRYGGFYYVESEGKVWTCRLRGRFRRTETDFLPGDRVEIVALGEDKGVIEAIKPRVSLLERPAVANVEQVVIVFTLSEPPPDLELLDRLLFMVSIKDLKAVLVWNKADIALAKYLHLPELYQRIGYLSLITSAVDGRGIEELRKLLRGRISTFAGPSGVGKSSLFNAMEPQLKLAIGEISEKVGRGRHTTRHAELIRLSAGGWVADTPGFSRLHIPEDITREEVAGHFMEMEPFLGQCRFNTCLHRGEPDCAVTAAVAEGVIVRHRYEHYLTFLNEVIAAERRY
ncbi:MAG: ribosome small subunit-dependent GTPase A [Clostridia bacterium]|nr:ribosome small subunit-dependent GTPase A [Clostridia bacterium]